MYFLAEQMGTSVHMIENHYGYVNTIKHADRVLQGMAGWELPQPEPDDTKAKAPKAAATRDQSKRGQRNKPRWPELPQAVFCRSRSRRLAQGGNRPNVRPGFSSLRLF